MIEKAIKIHCDARDEVNKKLLEMTISGKIQTKTVTTEDSMGGTRSEGSEASTVTDTTETRLIRQKLFRKILWQ